MDQEPLRGSILIFLVLAQRFLIDAFRLLLYLYLLSFCFLLSAFMTSEINYLVGPGDFVEELHCAGDFVIVQVYEGVIQ